MVGERDGGGVEMDPIGYDSEIGSFYFLFSSLISPHCPRRRDAQSPKDSRIPMMQRTHSIEQMCNHTSAIFYGGRGFFKCSFAVADGEY